MIRIFLRELRKEIRRYSQPEYCHWAIAAAIAAIIAAGISTYASVQQSEAQADLAKAQRKRSEVEAEQARLDAEFEEGQHRKRLTYLLGKQAAIFGASGIDPASGSPLTTMIDTVKEGEIEALNIRTTGEVSSAERMFEAGMAKYRGKFAKSQIPLQIASGVAQAGAAGIGAYGSWAAGQRRQTVLNQWWDGSPR